MRCPNCEAIINDDAHLCWMCHRPTVESALPSDVPPPPMSAPVETVTPPFGDSSGEGGSGTGVRKYIIAAAVLGALAIVAVVTVALLVKSDASKQPSAAKGLAVVTAYNTGHHWVGYIPVTNDFHVRFPQAPTASAKQTKISTITLTEHDISVQPGGSWSFVVAYFDVPANFHVNYANGLAPTYAALKRAGFSTVSYQPITVNGDTAADVSMQYGSVTARMRIIVDGNRLYAIQMQSPDSSEAPTAWTNFLKSFRLATTPGSD
jgi:hypothetical protein